MDSHRTLDDSPEKRAPNRTPAPSPRGHADEPALTPVEASAQAVGRHFTSYFDGLKPRASADAGTPRMRAVQTTTGAPNEITLTELSGLDPEGGQVGDWANPVLLTLMMSDGQTKAAVIAYLLEGHARGEGAGRLEEEQRVNQTITNMVSRGVLLEKDETLRVNIDLR